MKDYLRLIRVKHYLKNLLIFFPLFFSNNLININLFTQTTLAFLSFCFSCSIVYIINDIKDKEKDKLHEKKKNRPIASGKVSIKEAYILIFVLIILSIICFLIAGLDIKTGIYILVYIIINIFYSFGMKNIPLLDISLLASGFLIRVLYGAAVIDVEVSQWLYLTVISMAFYLVIGKRRNEIIKTGTETRNVLKYYTKEFLDKNMYMCLSLAIVFYSLWTMDYNYGDSMLTWTVPIVMLICMKYSMNVEKDGDGDPTDIIYGDKILLLLLSIYSISLISFIYFL